MQDPRHDPTPRLAHRAGRHGNIFSLRAREKNVLDFSSPKTLSSMILRDLESKFGGSFSEQLDLLLAESFLIVLSPFVHVCLTVLQHAIDKSDESMSHSGNGFWSP